MIQVGKDKVGCFYLKDKSTYCEMGGTYTVDIVDKYAKTCTNNVLLMIDENDRIIDIDDLPSKESNEISGENIISFVLGEKSCCFVVGEEHFDSDFIKMNTNSQGEVLSFSIIGEDFNLAASMDTSCTFYEWELEEGSFLIVYLDENPIVNKQNKCVSLFLACAKIVKI